MADRNSFFSTLAGLDQRITVACRNGGRNREHVTLLPVSKNHPAAAVEWAGGAGFRAVGENRVQEAQAKKAEVRCDLRWELIGRLQSNKVKLAVEVFDRIQTVDSVRLAGKIAVAAAHQGKSPYPVLLQVNAGRDPAKSGFELEEVAGAYEEILRMPDLRVEGLMTIAPMEGGRSAARQTFRRLRETRDALRKCFGGGLSDLSMGMSGDLEEAIAEGATIIRVGSALFGER